MRSLFAILRIQSHLGLPPMCLNLSCKAFWTANETKKLSIEMPWKISLTTAAYSAILQGTKIRTSSPEAQLCAVLCRIQTLRTMLTFASTEARASISKPVRAIYRLAWRTWIRKRAACETVWIAAKSKKSLEPQTCSNILTLAQKKTSDSQTSQTLKKQPLQWLSPRQARMWALLMSRKSQRRKRKLQRSTLTDAH